MLGIALFYVEKRSIHPLRSAGWHCESITDNGEWILFIIFRNISYEIDWTNRRIL